jgi:glycosyltransferase involved in cell wall biosynthesis
MTIGVIMSVFNEEARIEMTLRSLSWCDEIVILDKNSTDRTREIVQLYTDKIVVVPWREFRPEESRLLREHATSEWVFATSASDLIHPELAAKISELTSRKNFPYDVIHVPFRRFVLGTETKYSPWHSKLSPLVYRKQVAKINYSSVHGALTFNSDRHYKMPYSKEYCVYHLTHPTVDGMMERHMRYWRAEAQAPSKELSLRKAFLNILKAFYMVAFRRKTWLMGWDGVALSMAYLSYFMMQFVYVWEKRQSRAPQTYQNIRESIMQSWEKPNASKSMADQNS